MADAIAITGSTGLLGRRLVESLIGAGHTVSRVVRDRETAERPGYIFWRPSRDEIDTGRLEGHDVVIHLAGESIQGLWTPAKKRRIRDSRVHGTRLLAEGLAGLTRKPRVLFSASAYGYYGHRPPSETLDESSAPGDTFLADVCQEWEAAAEPASAAGIRVVYMRMSLVLSRQGGMLGAMLPFFRLGLGGKLGSGTQIVPWITRDDVVGDVRFLLDRHDVDGPVNFAAPNPVSNAELTRTLGRILDRPTLFTVPGPLLRLLGDLGDELLHGARVVPGRLHDAGYTFKHPTLEAALRSIL